MIPPTIQPVLQSTEIYFFNLPYPLSQYLQPTVVQTHVPLSDPSHHQPIQQHTQPVQYRHESRSPPVHCLSPQQQELAPQGELQEIAGKPFLFCFNSLLGFLFVYGKHLQVR